MTDLLVLAREHDLPPFWDGHAVLWSEWEPQLEVLAGGHFRPEPCSRCRSTARRHHARGFLAHRRSTTHDQLAGIILGPRPELLGYITLHAFRCPDCSHDQVLDSLIGGRWWDLEPDDYGARGSADPTGAPAVDDWRWHR